MTQQQHKSERECRELEHESLRRITLLVDHYITLRRSGLQGVPLERRTLPLHADKKDAPFISDTHDKHKQRAHKQAEAPPHEQATCPTSARHAVGSRRRRKSSTLRIT